MADSLLPATKDRFPWALLIVVFLLQAAIGAFFTLNQYREDLAHSEADMAANFQVLETILQVNLQSGQYQEIEPLLIDWIDLYQENVSYLNLTSANGFVLFHFHQEKPSDHFTSRSATITYSYQGLATLKAHWNLSALDHHVRETLVLLGMIQLITTLALTFFLRLATLRKRDARMLAARARELVQANKDLQREVEQRADIEKNLAKEKEQLQVTLRSLVEGVVSIDRHGIILLVNAAAEEMIGCPDNQCFGHSIDKILNLVEEDSEAGFRIFESGHLSRTGESPKEMILWSRTGDERFVSLGSSPITNEQGETTGWVVVLRDISGIRRLEQEQRKNSMLQALGVLAGGIAHDFNNILMAISGNLNLSLELSNENTELKEALSSAEKAIDRATDLTRQLLTFAQGGSPILDATAIDAVVQESAEFVTHGADLNIRYEFEEDLFPVLIDRHQIGQVIQNLVLNARQNMSPGSNLTIACANVFERKENRVIPMVRIEITDFGSGIPEADLEHIFDPYYTTKKEGSGLGLALVHSIITKHNGRIEVRSLLGEGTTFTIFLLASPDAPKAMDPDDGPLIKGTGRILIMDDDEAVRLVTSRMVRQLGFEVIEAEHGDQALEIYRNHLKDEPAIDLVITDLTVPQGMGGLETMQKLLEIDPECRAIVCSGYSGDPIMANHRNYGFQAALVKPFNFRQLNQALGHVLDQS